MTDLVDIYNLALAASGSRSRVSATTESSREAEECTLWYAEVRDQVLRAAFWPGARANQRLALRVERDADEDWVSTDPDPGYVYAYGVPADIIAPRYLSTFERFIISTSSDNSKVLCANTENAILTYTKRQTNINLWDAQLKMAIIYALAAHISTPLHGKNSRADRVEARANALILEARAAAGNTDEALHDTVPEWIAARGSAFATPPDRFIYPYGPLIQVTSGAGVT